MKKKNKYTPFMILSIFYFIILMAISTTYSFFNTNLSLTAKTEISSNTKEYTIDYILHSKESLNTTYTYNFIPTLSYLGSQDIVAWQLLIKVPYETEIISCSSNLSCTIEDETLSITSTSIESTINPNNRSISFNLSIKTTDENYQFEVEDALFFTDLTSLTNQNQTTTIKNINDFQPNLTINNESQYTLTIKNLSSTTHIQSWKAYFSFPNEIKIKQVTNANYQYDASTKMLTIQSATLEPNTSQQVSILLSSPNSMSSSITGVWEAKTTDLKLIKKDITIGGV